MALRDALCEIGLLLFLWLALCCVLCASACGGAAAGGAPPPSPPPSVIVQVTPSSATVLLGNSVGFSASVSGTPDATVSWAVNNIPGGNATMGSISPSGDYQAPSILPAPPNLQIVATSQVNPGSTGSASVAVMSDLRVQVTPVMANVPDGATQSFAASVLSAGHPSSSVSWSVAGPGCAGATCGMIGPDGAYTAPSSVPASPSVTVTATSVADPSKSASAAVQVVSTQVLAVAPANFTVALEQTVTFTATLDGLATQAVTWSVNGIAGGSTGVGTISNSPSQNGLYLAPVDMPAGRSVSITATSTTVPGLNASVTLQLTSDLAVSISPAEATRIPGARQSFTASVARTSDPQITWTVNGVPNGNPVFGQMCVSRSDPCVAPPLAVAPGSMDYLAPSAVPSPPQVTVEAVSVADPERSAPAIVTIATQISVSISPPNATLPPLQVQEISATVLGIADQSVTWDVNGAVNGSIADGLICLPASSPCQAPNGPSAEAVEYRAPGVPPAPNTVSVRVTSEASPAAQATAIFTISTVPYISGLVPASVFAGAAGSFGLRVEGVQFAPAQPGPGATVLINGAPRSTFCPSTTECETTLDPAGVSAAGMLAVSIQSGGNSPASSNVVNLVVVAPQSSQGSIPLTASAPAASGMDITVVEPTLEGDDPPEQLSLLEIGQVDPATGRCALGSPPLPLVRPSSGSTIVRLCVFGTALDQAAQVAFSAPPTPDLAASNLDTSFGNLLLEFDVTLPAAAATGARTLFVTTANQDQAALTAAVAVQ